MVTKPDSLWPPPFYFISVYLRVENPLIFKMYTEVTININFYTESRQIEDGLPCVYWW